MKPQTDYAHFEALDIRVGKIIKVEDSAAKKPTYRLTIDFGSDIGTRVSCGAFRHYPAEKLIGRQIIAIVNLGEKKMGPEVSQVFVLGAPNDKGEAMHLMPEIDVAPGVQVY